MQKRIVRKDEQIKLIMECRQSGLSDYPWILGNVTRIPRHELPQTLDFSDFLPLFT